MYLFNRRLGGSQNLFVHYEEEQNFLPPFQASNANKHCYSMVSFLIMLSQIAPNVLCTKSTAVEGRLEFSILCVCNTTLINIIHKLITSIWKKEKLPEEWKELIIVPSHKKGDKTDCNNYRDISLLPTIYKILSNILLSRLISYVKEIIGDHQCDFRRNRSTIDHVFCIRQILEKKWEYKYSSL